MQTPKSFNSQVAAKKQNDTKDYKDEQAKQSKDSVLFNGQQACAKLREAFDILSAALKLQVCFPFFKSFFFFCFSCF
jgi:hypothetical protein